MSLYKWSQSAGANAGADPSINWAEGQTPGSVNDSARAMMAAVAKYRDDIGRAGMTTGTGAAYAIATSQVLTALQDRFCVTFFVHATNTGAATLSVDGLVAKPLRLMSGVSLIAGELPLGVVRTASYRLSSDEFLVHAPADAGGLLTAISALQTSLIGMMANFPTLIPPTGWLELDGALLSRATYPELWAFVQAYGNVVTDTYWLGGLFGAFSTGDGSTTFRIPDMRGSFTRNWAHGGSIDSGRTAGQAQSSAVLNHTHPATSAVIDPGHQHPLHTQNTSPFTASGSGANFAIVGNGTTDGAYTGISVTTTVSNNSGGITENRPYNIAQMLCIRYR